MIKPDGRDALTLYLSAIAIAAVALWLRVAYFQTTLVLNPVRGEAGDYVRYARNLVEHQTFSKDRHRKPPVPDSYRAPGYPAYIAGTIYLAKRLGLDAYTVLIYTQSVLGAATCVLTLLLGRLFLPPYGALAAAVLTTFSPHLVSLGNCILPETLFCLALLVSVYSFLLAMRGDSGRGYLFSGVCFGAAYLTNSVSLLVVLVFSSAAVMLPGVRMRTRPHRRHWLPLLSVVPCLIIAIGWSVRGAISVPDNTPSSSDGLLTDLIIGTHPGYHQRWREDSPDAQNPATGDEQAFAGSYQKFLPTPAHRVAGNPGYYLKWYLLDKPMLLWKWNIRAGEGDIYPLPVFVSLYHTSKPAILTYTVMRHMHVWLLVFMLLGSLTLLHRFCSTDDKSVAALFVYLVVACCSVIYVVARAEPRYSIPLRPQLYLCASYFICAVLSLLVQKPVEAGQQRDAEG